MKFLKCFQGLIRIKFTMSFLMYCQRLTKDEVHCDRMTFITFNWNR
jgi:hypothetical protein